MIIGGKRENLPKALSELRGMFMVVQYEHFTQAVPVQLQFRGFLPYRD
jgi:hypothetical protein